MNNSDNTENKGKEIFDEMQAKQARITKRLLLGIFCGMGLLFAIVGAVFMALGDGFGEMGLIYLIIGLVEAVLGVIFYFVIPTKFNYEKYQARAQKYGMVDIYAMYAKITELEERLEQLEKVAQLEQKE